MAIKPLNSHYSMENPATIYDEESLTALQLAARTAAKTNEAVHAFNDLEAETHDHLQQQDDAIENRMTAQDNRITKMNDVTMPAKVVSEVQRHIDDGDFDAAINEYAGELKDRVDNLLGSVTQGATTMDAEVIDIRVRANGETHDTAGNASRAIDAQLQDLYFDVHSRLTPIAAKFPLTGYIGTEGQTINVAAGFRSGLIYCKGYTAIRYKTRLASSGYELAFYDVNKTFMPEISVKGREKFDEQIVTISDAGVYYVQLCGYTNTDSGVNKDTAYMYIGGANIHDEIKAVDDTAKEANTLAKSVIPTVVPMDTTRLVNMKGEFTSATGYHGTKPAPLAGYRYVEYATKVSDYCYAVAFFDENMVVMPDISIVGADKYVTGVIDVSNLGAAYVHVGGFSSSETQPTDFFCRLINRDIVKEVDAIKNGAGLVGVCEGKKMLVFGDSITETATMDDDGGNYVGDAKTNWVTYVTDYIGNANIKNYAHWGAHYADFTTDYYRQLMKNQLALAFADSSNDNPDVIVIAMGTNDAPPTDDYETAMNVATLAELDTRKLYQAIRYAMWSLRVKYPNAKCFVATPIQRASRENYPTISEAIRKMGNRYNFVVIDAENESGIIRENEVASGAGLYLHDGLHPNTAGKKKMAELFAVKMIPYFVKEV